MQKVLRIFSKDSRHLWPEIFLTLGLTFAFAASEHLTWPAYFNTGQSFQQGQVLAVWMNILMPIAWWLVIARAVHDESLVGDLQFWVTRPYGWPRLLAAKSLFALVYVAVPFLLAQIFLLHQAGLHPSAVLPGLALKILLLIGFILLPLMALSAVTPSLTRMLLLFLAFIVYVALAIWIIGTIFNSVRSFVPSTPTTDPWLYLLFLVPITAIAVIFLQYARRQTTLSTAILLALIAILTVTASEAAFGHRPKPSADVPGFPALASGEAAPLQIAFNPDPAAIPDNERIPSVNPGDIYQPENPISNVSIPVIVSGIAPGHAVRVEAGTLDANLPGQPPHTPGRWDRIGSATFVGATDTPSISWHQYVPVDHGTYKAALTSHLAVHLTYAVTEYEPVTTSTTTYNGGDLDLPQNGHCLERNHELYCQYALTAPVFTHVTWTHSRNCSGIMPRPVYSWIGEDDHGLTNTTFTPVINAGGPFVGRINSADTPCPGSAVTFTQYKVLRRRLLSVTLPPIDPSVYLIQPRFRQ